MPENIRSALLPQQKTHSANKGIYKLIGKVRTKDLEYLSALTI